MFMALALIFSVLICVWLLIQIWLTLVITSILPGLSGTFGRSFAETLYWFTVPHLILLPVTLAVVVRHAKRKTEEAFVSAIICLLCLLPTWFFAISMWSGGDDGPGMAWFFFLGGGALSNIVIGLPLLYIAHKIYQRNP